MRILLWALVGAVVLAIVAIAAIPLFVLLDLRGGGDGWGLCPGGLGACESSYFDGPELATALAIAILALVGLLRVLYHLRRVLARHGGSGVNAPGSPPRRPAAPLR